MQHVEGQSLKEILAGKALSLDHILENRIPVCEGQQAAHECVITHRYVRLYRDGLELALAFSVRVNSNLSTYTSGSKTNSRLQALC